MGQQELAKGIRDALGGGTFAALVGGRIYDTAAPDNAELPLACFRILKDEPVRYAAEGVMDLEAEFELEVRGEWGDGARWARQAGDLVLDSLDGAGIAISGWVGGVVVCLDRGETKVESRSYRHRSRWRVMASQAL